jgi:single-stranded-DNA-specific exonuclease
MTTSVKLPAPARRWVFRGGAAVDAGQVAALASGLALPPALCRLLVLRGQGEAAAARAFLRPDLERLGDPWALAGMTSAVARVEQALDRGETILVHGDYDVDGICSTALLVRVLRRLGGRAEPFVPRRLVDGYDLREAGVRAAVEAGAALILTADCGIVAHEAVAAAAAVGIDVVITDHHTPTPELPAAVAVVNPNRPDCGYPEKALAGAGVAFKLCQALAERRGLAREELWYHLDLVAVATVADLVPLTGENRILARFGLRLLADSRNPGLRALIRSAGLKPDEGITAGQVSHVLAPRMNAVGRMDEASWGVRLLLAEEQAEAARIAERLDAENRTRQAVDREILAQVLARLEQEFDPARDWGVVVAGEGWHPGVIGIVASRVVERIHRPTVLIALDAAGGPSRGSARSIPRFHLYDAIHSCAGELQRFGGHRYAAGLELLPERVAAFREAFNAHARQVLRPEDLVPEVAVDAELPLAEATPELLRLLRHLGPFGAGNPAPVFGARGVQIAGRPQWVGEGHVRLTLLQEGVRLPAIGFRLAERLRQLDEGRGGLDVAFQLQENVWNGRRALEAKLVDLRAAI